MMKKLRLNYFILVFTLLFTLWQPISYAQSAINSTIPRYLNITTEEGIIGSVKYKDFYLQAQKIITDVGPGYCLEVEKSYPTGQKFEVESKPEREIASILSVGYPNKSAEEIGVSSDDDAYLATQIAIWCVTDGYDVNKIKSGDKNITKAIRKIYNEGLNSSLEKVAHTVFEYYYSEDIQRVVVYIENSTEIRPQTLPDENNESGTKGKQDIVEDNNEETSNSKNEQNELRDTKVIEGLG